MLLEALGGLRARILTNKWGCGRWASCAPAPAHLHSPVCMECGAEHAPSWPRPRSPSPCVPTCLPLLLIACPYCLLLTRCTAHTPGLACNTRSAVCGVAQHMRQHNNGAGGGVAIRTRGRQRAGAEGPHTHASGHTYLVMLWLTIDMLRHTSSLTATPLSCFGNWLNGVQQWSCF